MFSVCPFSSNNESFDYIKNIGGLLLSFANLSLF